MIVDVFFLHAISGSPEKKLSFHIGNQSWWFVPPKTQKKTSAMQEEGPHDGLQSLVSKEL